MSRKHGRAAAVTARQRELLEQARESIAASPDDYDQATFGTGEPTCHTPACIAGHLVAADPELEQKLKKRLADIDTTTEEGREQAASEICQVAAEGLELSRTNPNLFCSLWPAEWRPDPDREVDEWEQRTREFTPGAHDALAVIDGILAGRITDALT